MKYNAAAIEAEKKYMTFIIDRMKEKGYTQQQLCEELQINKDTFTRYKLGKVSMPLNVLFRILGILEIRPYLIPKEIDGNEMMYITFN